MHTNGHTANVPWLNTLMNDNAVWIHEKVAKKMNLKKGDKIKITSNNGSQIGSVLPTIGIRDDTLFAYFGLVHISMYITISYGNGLIEGHLLENTISPVAGNNVHTIGVKIQKVEG